MSSRLSFRLRFSLAASLAVQLGCFAAPMTGVFRFREPTPAVYEVVEPDPGAVSASAPSEWVTVRRANGRGANLEMGRRVVLAVNAGVDQEKLTLGRPLVRVRDFSPGIVIWEAPDALTAAQQASELSQEEGVRAAYPVMRRDWVLHTPYAARPKDTLFFRQWHLENRASNFRPKGIDIDARAAWPITRGEGVTVAVADNGVDVGHSDLSARAAGQPHFNFATSTAAALGTAAADHGTSVAGLIAATGDNNRGVTGVAPAASLASFVIFASTAGGSERIVSDDALADMFRYKTESVAVQNHSWGIGADRQIGSDALSDAAIESAVTTGRQGKGVVIVRSAGNGRVNLRNAGDDGYASDPRVIAVAAVRQDGRATVYSNPGASILVGGPSGDPRPDGTEDPAAPNLVTTDRRGFQGYNPTSGEGGDYVVGTQGFNGTSGSAPIVSGVVALMLSARPALSYRDVQQLLALSSSHADLLDPDLSTNAAGLLVSHNQGFGVPDAGLAVALAKRWVPIPPLQQARVTRNSQLSIPDDSFRLILVGTGIPSNLRNLRVLPSMGVFPNGGTTAVQFDYVGKGHTNLPASVAGHAVFIAGGINSYADKIQRAAKAGATLAVIFGASGASDLEIMSGTAFSPIPAVYLGQTEGETLSRLIGGRTDVTARISTTSASMNLTVTNSMSCEHVGVRLRTSHTSRGDLRITLVSPKGTRSVLQSPNYDASPGPEDWTYWSTHHLMEPSAGTWRLQLTDVRQLDSGTLLGAELIINGVSIEDSDADGLDDEWERRWFGGLDRGPTDDVDADGLQLVREQRLDLSPVGGPSLFPARMAIIDGLAVRATFPTQFGRRYLLDYADTLGGTPTIYTNAPGRVGWTEMMVPLQGRDQRWFRILPQD